MESEPLGDILPLAFEPTEPEQEYALPVIHDRPHTFLKFFIFGHQF